MWPLDFDYAFGLTRVKIAISTKVCLQALFTTRAVVTTLDKLDTASPLPRPAYEVESTHPGRGGIFPMKAYTGRLRPKRVPFSGFRYMKGREVTS